MIIVFINVPKEKAEEIAKNILEKRLGACVNIVNCKTIFWWKGKIEESEEKTLIVKTRENLFDRIVEEIEKIHPYKIPEIICIKVEDVNKKYLEWLEYETSPKRKK